MTEMNPTPTPPTGMTPAEHYREAEHLLKRAENLFSISREPKVSEFFKQDARDLIAQAAVHAALAAAFAVAPQPWLIP